MIDHAVTVCTLFRRAPVLVCLMFALVTRRAHD
jgi:hypothetical protein